LPNCLPLPVMSHLFIDIFLKDSVGNSTLYIGKSQEKLFGILNPMANYQIVDIVLLLIAIVVSLTVHELMHGYVAYKLGDDTAKTNGRLSINPLRHVDPVFTVLLPVILLLANQPPFGAAKPVPIDPRKLRFGDWGQALVGAAGPISNFVLALMGAGVLRISGISSDIWLNFWFTFVSVNLTFFLLNLIPFPPLDGSRILYAFAPEPLQRLMQKIEQLGMVAILMFFFVIFPLLLTRLTHLHQSLLRFIVGF
jgi:Zn-dependent protease